MSHLYVTQERDNGRSIDCAIGVYSSLLLALIYTVKAYESGLLYMFDVTINGYSLDTEVVDIDVYRATNLIAVNDENTVCNKNITVLNVYLSKETENATEIINDLCKATGFLWAHSDFNPDQYSIIYTITKDKQNKG